MMLSLFQPINYGRPKNERLNMSKERKAEAVDYLSKAKATLPRASQADQIRLAVARFILDQLGEKDQSVRHDVVTAFLEMPSFFGASANAMQECPDYVKREDKFLGEFTA